MQKKMKEIKPGELFTFGGYEWIKLEQAGLVLTKNIVTAREFDDKSNDFNMANIRSYLKYVFYKSLASNGVCGDNFELVKLDFTADDGTLPPPFNYVNYVALLTAALYRKNRHLLTPINASWWLATPESYLKTFTSSVMVVTSYGIITTEYTDYSRCGVRPLCKLSDETEVEVDCPSEETEVEVDCPSEETEDLTELIKRWATDRNVTNGDTKSQMVKLLEEAGELAEVINKNKQDLIVDSIGDVYVVLVILCMQLGLDINDCVKVAYEEIKDRKGKLVNGLFVKEEDL